MQWSVKLQDGQKLVVDKEFWTGKVDIRLGNGIVGKMGMKRQDTFALTLKDGTQHSLTIKHSWLDPIPYILLDGNDVMASKRFSKVQTAIICLPALLIFNLGAIPALIGVGGVYLNFFIARQDEVPAYFRWSAIGVVPIIGFAVIALISGIIWGTQKEAKTSNGYHLKTTAPTHQYDPTEDDNDPRLWAHPRDAAETARQERWVREGR